jgi:putative ABC transport system permease protein
MNILLLKTFRDLRASLAQFIALIVIVLLGMATYVASISSYRDLGSSYNRTYDQLKLADVSFNVQSAPESIADELAALDGVQAVEARLVVDAGLELPAASGQAQEPIRARLIGVPAEHHPVVDDVLLLKGNYLAADATASVLIETHFAAFYHLGPGDSVTPILNGQQVNFQISGVIASPEYLIVSPSKQDFMPSARSFGVFFVPEAELQSQMGIHGQVNNLAVLLQRGANQAAVVQAIQQKLVPYGLSETTLKADQPSNAALNADLTGFQEIAYLMPIVFLLVAAASVYVMLGRQVRAQTPQIGLMKALGYTNRAVMGHYLLYALVIGVIGSVLGALLGIPLGYTITKGYANSLSIPIVEAHFYPALILEGMLLGLAATVLAGLGPARGAVRLAPAQAMRLDPAIAQVKGRVSGLERILRLPLWLRLPVRSVFRVRRRSLTTALGIVFAYVLFLMVLGLLDSINYFFIQNYQVVEKWDETVLFNAPQPQTIFDQIQEMAGVKQVDPLSQMPVTLKANGKSDDILLTAFSPDQPLHQLQLPKGITPTQAFQGGRLVITDGLAKKMGLKEGDTATLSTSFGDAIVTIGPQTNELMAAVGYLSLDGLAKLAGSPAPMANGAYLTVDKAQVGTIKSALYHLPGAVSVQRKTDVISDLRSYMNLFYAIMGVMLVFSLLMAFALLFNAMTVNVLERGREFATMRSIGTGRRTIALLLATENLILWAFTLIPGLILGYLMALGMGSAFNTDLFSFKIVVTPLSYVITSVGILLTMLLAALPAIQRVNRLNLAEATKVLT